MEDVWWGYTVFTVTLNWHTWTILKSSMQAFSCTLSLALFFFWNWIICSSITRYHGGDGVAKPAASRMTIPIRYFDLESMVRKTRCGDTGESRLWCKNQRGKKNSGVDRRFDAQRGQRGTQKRFRPGVYIFSDGLSAHPPNREQRKPSFALLKKRKKPSDALVLPLPWSTVSYSDVDLLKVINSG